MNLTPGVDTAVAQISGLDQPGRGAGIFCFLLGITTPFTEEQLAGLYQTHENFIAKWNEAAQSARRR